MSGAMHTEVSWAMALNGAARNKARLLTSTRGTFVGSLFPHLDLSIVRLGKNRRDRANWEARVATFSEEEFRAMYKVTRAQWLADLVAPQILPDDTGKLMALVSSGSYVSAETALVITLRFLAGGNAMDNWTLHGVSRTACREKVCVWGVPFSHNVLSSLPLSNPAGPPG